jgi:hypothetical protein
MLALIRARCVVRGADDHHAIRVKVRELARRLIHVLADSWRSQSQQGLAFQRD